MAVGGDSDGEHGDLRFSTISDRWLGRLPAGFTAIAFSPANVPDWRYPQLPSDLLHLLNGDGANLANGDGAGFVSYFGHGDVDTWLASDLSGTGRISGLELLRSVDVDGGGLANHRAFPFVTALNCLNGFFAGTNDGRGNDYPSELTFASGDPSNYKRPLAEALMLQPDRGAIAMLASASLSYPTEQIAVGDALYERLFANGERDLGRGVTDAMRSAVANGADPAVVSILTLFGDPATRLQLAGRSDPAVVATAGGGGGGGFVFVLPLLLVGLAFARASASFRVMISPWKQKCGCGCFCPVNRWGKLGRGRRRSGSMSGLP